MAGRRNPDKERQWRQWLALWQDSGLSARDFCAQQRLALPSFYAWKRQLLGPSRTTRRSHAAAAATPPALVPVRLVGPEAAALELTVAGGHTLRVLPGFDAATLQRLLAVLEGRAC